MNSKSFVLESFNFGKNSRSPDSLKPELVSRLGAGSYGTVSKAVHKILGFHILVFCTGWDL